MAQMKDYVVFDAKCKRCKTRLHFVEEDIDGLEWYDSQDYQEYKQELEEKD